VTDGGAVEVTWDGAVSPSGHCAEWIIPVVPPWIDSHRADIEKVVRGMGGVIWSGKGGRVEAGNDKGGLMAADLFHEHRAGLLPDPPAKRLLVLEEAVRRIEDRQTGDFPADLDVQQKDDSFTPRKFNSRLIEEITRHTDQYAEAMSIMTELVEYCPSIPQRLRERMEKLTADEDDDATD